MVGYSAKLVRATPGTALTNLGTGRYDVKFPASVRSARTWPPSVTRATRWRSIRTTSTPDRPAPDTVYIETKNQGGGLSSGIPFHLAVICPTAANVKTAVVSATGILARGSALTSSYSSATGQYTVATNQAVTACATWRRAAR